MVLETTGRAAFLLRWVVAGGLGLGALLVTPARSAAGILDATWIAPTTTADGVPLTDLAGYRVFYSNVTDSPCTGSTYTEVVSPTLSPPPDQEISVRLHALTTGSTYHVTVTAVNTRGAESACSTMESAVARVDVSVSPTGTMNFGSVAVGSSADRTFTVQNTAGGTVSGTVSVPAPFSVVSGSPFTLAGLNTTQAVTVRFTPATGATAAVNVSFVADGDTQTRIVTGTGTGTGTAVDTTPPAVNIITPTSSAAYSTSAATVTLGGTASDGVGVTQVTWANNLGGSGTATGTTSWIASGVVLKVGTNVLTVMARDSAGNIGTDTLTVTYTPALSASFTDDPLVARTTVIKAVHVTELRQAINALRGQKGLPAFTWTDPTLMPGRTPFKLVHVLELRTALNEVYAARGVSLPIYTHTKLAVGQVVTAIDMSQLRDAVRALQ